MHAGFHEAVGEFCREEHVGIERYIQTARQGLPLKRVFAACQRMFYIRVRRPIKA